MEGADNTIGEKKARVERADKVRSGSGSKNRAQHKRACQEVQEIFFPDVWEETLEITSMFCRLAS